MSTTQTLMFSPVAATKPRRRWFARLMDAMHETREREATQVLHRHQHLLPDGGPAAKSIAKEKDHGVR